MSPKDTRRNIKVSEVTFEEFNERKRALGISQTEMLEILLQKEITKTETTTVENMKKRIE